MAPIARPGNSGSIGRAITIPRMWRDPKPIPRLKMLSSEEAAGDDARSAGNYRNTLNDHTANEDANVDRKGVFARERISARKPL